jgi:hypothetical protein
LVHRNLGKTGVNFLWGYYLRITRLVWLSFFRSGFPHDGAHGKIQGQIHGKIHNKTGRLIFRDGVLMRYSKQGLRIQAGPKDRKSLSENACFCFKKRESKRVFG